MIRFLFVLILLGIGYFGYTTYVQKKPVSQNLSFSSASTNLKDSVSTSKIDNFTKVLGASISKTLENGKTILSDSTKGKSDPIINQLVSKTQETLKDLPRKEAEKIKYEFCKGVITEYENKSTNN